MLSDYRPMLLSLFESLQRLVADPFNHAGEAQAIQKTLIEQISAAEARFWIAKQVTDYSYKVTEPSDADNETIENEKRLLYILIYRGFHVLKAVSNGSEF